MGLPCGKSGTPRSKMAALINKAWNDSFARVEKNKHAIAERGWYPLNRNILLNDELRSTMTPAEVRNEITSDAITIPSPYFEFSTSDSTIISSSSSTQQPSLNFSSGAASLCLDTIITSEDLKFKSDSDALIATGKTIDKFNQKELTTILKSLKRAGDKALPTRKKDSIELYHKWKDRPPPAFDYSCC